MTLSKRSECIANTSYTPDGIRIEGHPYVALCAIYDEEHDRMYHVLQCENCGKLSAGFQDGQPENAADMYGQILKVAG